MKNTTILLVEDDLDDELLTLRVLQKNNIGKKVFVVRDGVEALDFLFCMNFYAGCDPQDLPQLGLLDLKIPKIDVSRCYAVFAPINSTLYCRWSS